MSADGAAGHHLANTGFELAVHFCGLLRPCLTDAGVVHQNIEAAEALGDARKHHLDLGARRDITGNREPAIARRAHRVHRLGCRLRHNVVDRNRGAFLGESQRDGASDAGASARNQSYTSFEFHQSP